MLAEFALLGMSLAAASWAAWALVCGRITVPLKTEFRLKTYHRHREPGEFWFEVITLLCFAVTPAVVAVMIEIK